MIDYRTFKSREEWLQARKNKIGGSDASCILGLNPYKSNVQLWKEKTKGIMPEDISGKACVKYGNEAESHLRELFKLDFEKEYIVKYEENNMFFNEQYPQLHASLDGWLESYDGRKGILEIKTSTISSGLQYRKWDNQIPQNYYIQLLHYFIVTGFDFAVLKAQLKYLDDTIRVKHYFFERCQCSEDIEYLLEKEKEFLGYIASGEEPPLILPEL